MGNCGSCGAQVDVGAHECRHCGMPVLLAASQASATPETAAPAAIEAPATTPDDAPAAGHSPPIYKAFSPLVGAPSEQQSNGGNELHVVAVAANTTSPATAGFGDWRAAAVANDEPDEHEESASAPTGDAAHALYPGYIQHAADGMEASAQPPDVGLADQAVAEAAYDPHDLRAVSAFGLRYRDVSVTRDKIHDNATTSEPSEEQVKGSIEMVTATSVARVIVRPIGEGASDQSREREFALDGRTVTVGRSPTCDISLEGDQLASRRHALLRAEGDRYTLVDLGSSNGSFVNDVEIQEPTVLHDGDHITIGEHDLLFLTGPASPSASVAGERIGGEQVDQHVPQNETSPHPAVASTPAGQSDQAQQASAQQNPWEAPASFAPPTPQASDAPVAPAQPALAASSAPSSGMITPVTPPMPSATAGAEALEKIRAQLTEASLALAQQSEAEARLAEERRATVQEISSLLNDLLAQEQDSALPSSEDVEALAQVARDTAANPRHLDSLNALAARASDLAQALEAQKQWLAKRADLLNTLNALRAKLDKLD